MSSSNTPTHLVINTTYANENYIHNLIYHSKNGIRNAKPYFASILIYVSFAMVYLAYLDQLSMINLRRYATSLLPEMTIILPTLFFICAVLSAIRRGKHRRTYALKKLFSSRSVSNFLVGLFVLTAFVVFLSMFTAMKGTFGHIFGFDHDSWQADLDKLLFLGVDPWRFLFLPIHSLELQSIIEVNYNVVWHVQLFSVLAIVAYSGLRTKTSIRYLLCTLFVWSIIGSLFASMFLSAGPAFYGLVTGDELRFGEQMALLAEYKNGHASLYQAYLWNAYITKSSGIGTGIAAFPSLHVSFVVLHTLFAFEINKKLGFFALAYALFVWFSSVYLAWHYAIDGIAGGILVVIIYYVVRKVTPEKKANSSHPRPNRAPGQRMMA